jgi:serine protease
MKTLKSAVVSTCLALASFGAVAAEAAIPASKFLRAEKPVAGRYIVVLADAPPGIEAVGSIASGLAQKYGGRRERTYAHALRGFVVEGLNETQARRLAQDVAVKYVEEDGIVQADISTQTPATWGLDRIDQRGLPLDTNYTYHSSAYSVHAYILDTGIRTTHTEFGGRATGDFTAINDGYGAEDCNGHGTHVAGTVGGSTYGVAKSVNLHAVRVLGCSGSGTWSGVISGVDWVTANHIKPAVANMSLGGGANQAVDDAIRNSIAAGVTYAVAAGNGSGADACAASPARVPEALTVGSTTNGDQRSSFSSIGTCLDLFAPGSDITSAWSTADDATNIISGTSMATPHVAGVAALYLSVHHEATPAQVASAITSNAIANVVTDPGTGSPNRLLNSGFVGTVMTNGFSYVDAATSGNVKYFVFTVPAGKNQLDFNIYGGTGDADLYVKYGSLPTTSSYDCRPYLGGNTEKCSFTSPASGNWYVMLRSWSTYADATLRGVYSTALTANVSLAGQSGSTLFGSRYNFYTLYVPAGTLTLTFSTSGGTGDVDMRVRYGDAPVEAYDCSSALTGNEERCSFTNPTPGLWYVRLTPKSKLFSGSYSSVSLTGAIAP